jgi:hypothetical protein
MFMSASSGDGGIDLMHLVTILHKLSFAVTKKKSCILRGGIF